MNHSFQMMLQPMTPEQSVGVQSLTGPVVNYHGNYMMKGDCNVQVNNRIEDTEATTAKSKSQRPLNCYFGFRGK